MTALCHPERFEKNVTLSEVEADVTLSEVEADVTLSEVEADVTLSEVEGSSGMGITLLSPQRLLQV